MTSEERLNVCKTCESFTEKSKCSECGCYMPMKVLFPLMSCPKDKWKK